MVGVRRKGDVDQRKNSASPEELHKRYRSPNTGRIPKALKVPYKVKSSELRALQNKLFERVGWLAAGWNKAAQKLGLSGRQWPAWIARHSSAPGHCTITSTETLFRVEVANTVKFVGQVKDLNRWIQNSINYQANAMNREAVHLLEKALKASGWRS